MPDEQKLEGTWERVRFSVNGRAWEVKPGANVVTLSAGRLKRVNFGAAGTEWMVTVDATPAPRRLDLSDGTGARVECVYRLEGDRLTLCWGGRVPVRPRAVESGPGVCVEVLRRSRRGR